LDSKDPKLCRRGEETQLIKHKIGGNFFTFPLGWGEWGGVGGHSPWLLFIQMVMHPNDLEIKMKKEAKKKRKTAKRREGILVIFFSLYIG